ncbi:hypothetical protein SAMN04515674_12374 [Pseudarcicella hirudinis]|uniref:SH3 domain-containing protein n=1 Tax=Pseudarcicella hirudinis TaxID=1079859 RepID=A0A1I5Z386_9BACT|nr:hypothetical protein [Pseudarcicella hirudinis]SFQ50577.1 hypothetical protein SAMN04515674_12374 [Pseudarcicella hirudinis]
MEKYLIILMIFLSISCLGQSNNKPKLDTIPFDLSQGHIYDTTYIDLNLDNKKDIFIKFSYYNFDVNIPTNEYQQQLAIYFNVGDEKFIYICKNKSLLFYVYTSIKKLDSGGFVVINEGSGQDWNRYYCYFIYDKSQNEWFLYKNEVYRAYYEKGKDTESLNLISKQDYQDNQRIKFSEVNFVKLFQKFLEEVPDPPYYEKIKVDRAIIFSEPEVKTSMYLIKGDEVKIVKEKGGYLKIYYFGKNRIEGWIKKTDVE